MTMHTVYMHGSLKDKYSAEPITLDAKNVKEVIRGLQAAFGRGFYNTIKDGSWQITRGKRKVNSEHVLERDTLVKENEVEFNFPDNEIHIFPSLSGAGKFGRIILGVVLIIVGIALAWLGQGWIAALGISMIATGALTTIQGIIDVLSGSNKINPTEAEQQPISNLYNGPVNVVEQGGPVQVVYGLFRCGSTVISADLELVQTDARGNILPNENYTFDNGIGDWTGQNATIEEVDKKMKVTVTGAQPAGAVLDLTPYSLNADQRYKISGTSQTDGNALGLQMVVYDDAQIYVTSQPHAKDSWGIMVGSFVMPSSLTGTLKLGLIVDGQVGEWGLFDNIRVTEIYAPIL